MKKGTQRRKPESDTLDMIQWVTSLFDLTFAAPIR